MGLPTHETLGLGTRNTAPHARRGADGLAIIGRTLHDLRGIRFDENETGNTPPVPTPPPAPTPTPPPAPTPPEQTDEERGFPLNTPVAQMTPEQQAAYWRNESKKHQKIAESQRDYEQLKKDAAELATLKAANATDQERAVNTAKAEGAAEAQATLLKNTVPGLIATLAGKSLEDLGDTLEVLDVTKFGSADGGVDLDKVAAFAKTLAPSADGGIPPIDPVRAALERQGHSPSGHGGSIDALENARYEQLTSKNKSSK